MNIALLLDNWYQHNKRQLPWRQTNNAYYIWLSEVILQQTRVAQGTNYYLKFVATYPTLQSLASANLIDVLKLWEGLGYYSRARNLHQGAIQIVENHNGKMPQTYTELLKIKGIGPYTAAAISSICYGEKKAVLDGNVYRVLSRLYGVFTPINTTAGAKQFAQLANSLMLLAPDAGQYNQAIMEFGALQCTPKNPSCQTCILASACIANQENYTAILPVRIKNKPVKHRFLNYLIILLGTKIAVQQRAAGDIWHGLYEFPMIETNTLIEKSHLLLTHDTRLSVTAEEPLHHQTHKLTHQLLHVSFWSVSAYQDTEHLVFVEFTEIELLPFPVVIKNFIARILLPLLRAK